jgi:hypothetical protein
LNLLDLLYQALDTPQGIAVPTDNVPLLRQKLYALRKGDPQLHVLGFSPSPTNPTTELWILRKEAPGAPEAE